MVNHPSKGPPPVLSQNSIAQLIAADPPLVRDFLSLKDQLQPNGFDLTLQQISRLETPGILGADPSDRTVSQLSPIPFDPDGWADLPPGHYSITFSEIVSLPPGLAALGQSRTSLLRSGVSVPTGVWDAGYSGRSQALLVVHNHHGFRVQKGARLVQLVFFRLDDPTGPGYQGRYQGENL